MSLEIKRLITHSKFILLSLKQKLHKNSFGFLWYDKAMEIRTTVFCWLDHDKIVYSVQKGWRWPKMWLEFHKLTVIYYRRFFLFIKHSRLHTPRFKHTYTFTSTEKDVYSNSVLFLRQFENYRNYLLNCKYISAI